MKRPLECLAGGFVLGEVLALLPVGWMAGILAVLAAGVCCLRKKCGRSLAWRLLPVFCIWGAVWYKGDLWKADEYRKTAEEASQKDVEAEGTVAGIQGRRENRGVTLELADVTLRWDGRKKEYGDILVYADEGEGLHIGERIWVRGRLEPFARQGNPGEFDSAGYYHAIGIEGRFFAEKTVCLQQGHSPYFDGIYRIRCHSSAVLDLICTEDDRGVFKTMLLGEKAELSPDIKKLYQSSGISHILAVSGLHISMIGLGCYGLLRKAGMGLKGAGAIGAAVTASYGILAGGTGISASVTRAVLMVLMQMWADYLGRTYDMRTAVSVSGLLLLLQSPQLLFQAGFQLSFGAVLTLGAAEPAVEKWLRAKKGWQKTVLAGIMIQLATCPVIAYHYFEYPVYGIMLNLMVIPLMSYVLISGILAVVLGCAGLRAGMAAIGTGHYVLEFYRWICQKVQSLPGAVLVTGRPGRVQIGMYGIMWAVFLAVVAARGKAEGKGTPKEREEGSFGNLKAQIWRRAVFMALFAGMSLGVLFFRFHGKGMEVTFLDVGQGDGICICAENAVILVDGGSADRKEVGAQVVAPFLKSQGIARVDYAIVSHGDQDHISGLMEIMEEGCGIEISYVILPWLGQGGEDGIYENIEQAARKHRAQVAWMKRGDRIEEGAMKIDCLYAGEERQGQRAGSDDRNEHSLMLQVSYGQAGILLTGDMSSAGEAKWLEKGETPRIQVLKVAHHGSSYSTRQDFLQRIKPWWAVISCGAGNRYGHPGEDTLKRLEKQGTKQYVTADTGAVTVTTDGKSMEIRTFIDSP